MLVYRSYLRNINEFHQLISKIGSNFSFIEHLLLYPRFQQNWISVQLECTKGATSQRRTICVPCRSDRMERSLLFPVFSKTGFQYTWGAQKKPPRTTYYSSFLKVRPYGTFAFIYPFSVKLDFSIAGVHKRSHPARRTIRVKMDFSIAGVHKRSHHARRPIRVP